MSATNPTLLRVNLLTKQGHEVTLTLSWQNDRALGSQIFLVLRHFKFPERMVLLSQVRWITCTCVNY